MARLEVSRNDVRRSSFGRYRGAELQNLRLHFSIIAIEAMSSEDRYTLATGGNARRNAQETA